MSRDVVTVIGVGGMGVAIARRLAAGRSLLLADVSEASLEAAASQLVRAVITWRRT
jgi:3-hydroxyacyl-CoA dehydrogenase